MTRQVDLSCKGRPEWRHRKESLAMFRSYLVGTEAEGYVEEWEEVPVGTPQYHAQLDALVEQSRARGDVGMGPFDAMSDHPGKPRTSAIQAHLVGNVPVPEDMTLESFAFWQKQDSRPRFEASCPRPGCPLRFRATSDRLFPILTETNRTEYGVASLALWDLIGMLTRDRG